MTLQPEKIQDFFAELDRVIVGQKNLKRDILICLLSGGHILLEWAPWLAKTLTVNTVAKAVGATFQRIQFTPDLLPSDLIGAKIYDPASKSFSVKKGPIFANFVLADEINRAPSKVQSALLEAMEERQVTIGEETFSLSHPFMVLATQNPIEQEGTFHLPEAQLDRFLMKTLVEYPTPEEEIQIMKEHTSVADTKIRKIFTKKDISEIKKNIEQIQVSESIYDYVRDIVFFTREDQSLKKYLTYGASPRASLGIIRAAKTLAYIEARDFVIPEDIKSVAYGVLRHRIILSYEALAEEITPDMVIRKVLSHIEIS